ncbi:MAG: hypothetical protein IT581_21665 [Verrucomicrobiales bacterium]|nr:hypothetical protein [Verrucomicrobiales bacterium]
MLRKILLSALAFLFLAPPAFVAFENFRGRTELDAVLADLTAKGETMDIRKIAPPPIPAASNSIQRFLTAADAVALNAELQPPALQWIAPARAVAGASRTNWMTNDGREMEWSQLADWKSNHLADLTRLRDSLAEPARQPVLNYDEGFNLLLPHLAKMKSAVNALGASMSESAHRGDFEAALEDLRSMRQVADDLRQQPLLIDQLVRVACEAIASSRAWELLHSHAWSDEQLAKLQATMEDADLMDGMLTALTGERALVVATLAKLPTRDLLQLGDVGANDGNRNSSGFNIGALGGSLLRLTWGNQALAHYLKTFQSMLETNRLAAKQHSIQPVESLSNLPSLSPWNPRHFLTRMLLPALEKSSTKALRAETERALLRTGIALRRYQLRHQGKVPANLQALVPELLDAVPLDRMDGAPLRYRADTATEFTLWSLGQDRLDNDGDGSVPKDQTSHRGNFYWWLAVDAVWPQPASAEEVAAWQQTLKDRRSRRNLPATNAPMTMSPDLMRRYGLSPGTNATAPATSTNAP